MRGRFKDEVRGEAISVLVRGRALIFPLGQAEDIQGLRV